MLWCHESVSERHAVPNLGEQTLYGNFAMCMQGKRDKLTMQSSTNSCQGYRRSKTNRKTTDVKGDTEYKMEGGNSHVYKGEDWN